ncbi:hypothetical protein TNCV_2740671 [Trichonephila clavipes]|nr:hypothetical protein TNCV_2740671 [Trichonephila clavipes]
MKKGKKYYFASIAKYRLRVFSRETRVPYSPGSSDDNGESITSSKRRTPNTLGALPDTMREDRLQKAE